MIVDSPFTTEMALMTLVDDLWLARDRGGAFFLALSELLATFDTINYDTILNTLRGLGAVLWQFRSFLFQVQFQRERSSPKCLCCGLPQDVILLPLMINIYVVLGEVISQHGVYNQYVYMLSSKPQIPIS